MAKHKKTRVHRKTGGNIGNPRKTRKKKENEGKIGRHKKWLIQGKTQENRGICGKTCRGKHRNTWENIETHWDTWGNRKTGKKQAGRENIAKPQKNRGKKENTGINGNTDTGEAQENRGQKQ